MKVQAKVEVEVKVKTERDQSQIVILKVQFREGHSKNFKNNYL